MSSITMGHSLPDARQTVPPPQKQRPDRIGFFDLSGELRNRIYKYALTTAHPSITVVDNRNRIVNDDRFPWCATLSTCPAPASTSPARKLLYTCKAVGIEARDTFYKSNLFTFHVNGFKHFRPIANTQSREAYTAIWYLRSVRKLRIAVTFPENTTEFDDRDTSDVARLVALLNGSKVLQSLEVHIDTQRTLVRFAELEKIIDGLMRLRKMNFIRHEYIQRNSGGQYVMTGAAGRAVFVDTCETIYTRENWREMMGNLIAVQRRQHADDLFDRRMELEHARSSALNLEDAARDEMLRGAHVW